MSGEAPGGAEGGRLIEGFEALIRANLDQDIQEARAWMRANYPGGTGELWLYMNQKFEDRRLELMSQFAILAFERAYLEVHGHGPERVA